MDTWQRVFRVGLAPQLSTRGLLALKQALLADAPELLQGTTAEPPALDCCRDWPCDGACPVAYCGWHGGELDSAAVGAVTDFFAAVAAKADELTGEYASIRHFSNFVDGSPRAEMRRELLAEVSRVLSERAIRAAPPPADGAAVEYGVLRHPRHEDTTELPTVALVVGEWHMGKVAAKADAPSDATLRQLHDACALAALPAPPGALSPLAGYCDAVAEVVRGIFGGKLVTGTVDGINHYWNRLPDGREVDLTSCQFGGDGLRPRFRGRVVRPQPRNASVRTVMFGMKVRRVLNETHEPLRRWCEALNAAVPSREP